MMKMKPCIIAFVLLTLSAPAYAQISEMQAIQIALQKIMRHKLVSQASIDEGCIKLVSDDPSIAKPKTPSFLISVYGNNDDICGGDPDVMPHFFDILVDTKTGATSTNKFAKDKNATADDWATHFSRLN